MKKYIIYYKRIPGETIGFNRIGLNVEADSDLEACIKSLEELDKIICMHRDPEISRGYTFIIDSIYLVEYDNLNFRQLSINQ
jgi:hypothetical protein